jgi:hypothetical protein
MALKRKIGGAVLALALVAGAIPGFISSASAVETGQLLDRGRWPRNFAQAAVTVVGLAALIAGIVVLTSKNKDAPTSP